MSKKCCLDYCRIQADDKEALQSNITFHKIPVKEKFRAQWMSVLKQHSSRLETVKHLYVCSQHFIKSDFNECISSTRKQLHPGKVPTIFFIREKFLKKLKGTEGLNLEVKKEVVKDISSNQLNKNNESSARSSISQDVTILTAPQVPIPSTTTKPIQFILIPQQSVVLQLSQSNEPSFPVMPITQNQAEEIRVKDEYDNLTKIPSMEGIYQSFEEEEEEEVGNLLKNCENCQSQQEELRRRNFKITDLEKELEIYKKKLLSVKKEYKNLLSKYVRCNKKISNLKTKVTTFKTMPNMKSDDINLSRKAITLEDFKRLTSLECRSKLQLEQPWHDFCDQLYLLSPRAYKHVRNEAIRFLPHPKTVVKWRRSTQGNAKNDEAIEDVLHEEIFECGNIEIDGEVSHEGTELCA